MKDFIKRITEHPFFMDMSPENVAIAASGARERIFEPDDLILVEGEPADRFYLIESGSVVLEAHEPADGTFLIQPLKEGDVLGWSWLLSPYVWHFQARALEPTRTISLDAAHLLVAAEENHQFGYELMKRVAHVLMSRMKSTRSQLIASRKIVARYQSQPGPAADSGTVTRKAGL